MEICSVEIFYWPLAGVRDRWSCRTHPLQDLRHPFVISWAQESEGH
jgi:hypothetical protein